MTTFLKRMLKRFPNALPIALIIFFGVVSGIAMSVYTGPNRTTTSYITHWERTRCVTNAVCDPPGVGYYSCTMTTYTAYNGTCSIAHDDYFTAAACGWPYPISACPGPTNKNLSSSVVTCTSGQPSCSSWEETVTTSLPPATVSSVANCATSGSSGWCVGGATLTLSANDPVFSIAGIEGTPGLLCGSSSCVYYFPEGVTNLNFWALSSHGDTSYASSASMNLDSIAPSANAVSLTGTAGSGGWYRSNVVVTASGSDVTSGVGSTQVLLNGTTANPSPYTLSAEGSYTVQTRITDIAGHTTLGVSASVSIDKTAPTASLTPTLGALGLNGWYLAPASFLVSGSDATSGVSSEIVMVGGTPQGNLYTLNSEGTFSVYGLVTDVAGNQTSTTAIPYKVDLSDPTGTLNISGTAGTGYWYRSPATLSLVSSDSGSGVATANLSVDGTDHGTSYTISAEGLYTTYGEVEDNAGRMFTTPTSTVGVDLSAPAHVFTTNILPNANGWYSSPVTVTIPGTDTLSGYDFGDYSLTSPGGVNSGGSNTVTLSENGTYSITVYGQDFAGNQSTPTDHTIKIDTSAPVVTVNPIPSTISGTMTLSGNITDPTSGLDYAEYSTNGGSTWKPLTVLPGGAFSQDIDNTTLPGGSTNFVVRAFDLSGLTSSGSVSGIVSNRPPNIELTSAWLVKESGTLKVSGGDSAISSVTITICDTEDKYPCLSSVFYPGNIPNTVSWDGLFGSTKAVSGEYIVTVIAKDVMGRSASAKAKITVPEIIYFTPTPLATVAPTETIATSASTRMPETLAPAMLVVATQPDASVVLAVEGKPTERVKGIVKFKTAPYFILMGFIGVLGFAALTDPRPKQWERVAKALRESNEDSRKQQNK